jgi:hypothetical protein
MSASVLEAEKANGSGSGSGKGFRADSSANVPKISVLGITEKKSG